MIIYPFGYLSEGINAFDLISKSDGELIEMFKDTLCFKNVDNELIAYAKTNSACTVNNESGQHEFNFRDAYRFYHKLTANAPFPPGLKAGNGFELLEYEANGEASDWMLAHRGIYAMSPELSITEPATETFFMEDAELVKRVLRDHYPWVKYTITNMLEDEQIIGFQDQDGEN